MIFVKNKTDNTHAKLATTLGASKYTDDNEENKEKFDFNKLYNNEVNKFRKPVFKKNNNLIRSGENAILQKSKHRYNLTSGDLKNSGLYSMNTRGYTPCDPYLINSCKQAIIHVKKELPNYRDIINKINSEFGIVETNYLNTEFSKGNKTCRSFSNNNFALTKYSNTNNNLNNISSKFYRTFNNDFKEKSNHIDLRSTKDNIINLKGNE